MKKEDGRLQAYGWSLPPKSPPTPASGLDPETARLPNTNVPVPVPVYCRPLMEKEPGMKVSIGILQQFCGNEVVRIFELK